MITVLSLVTSVKDYIEIAHKLVEIQNPDKGVLSLTDYTELGAVLTYVVLSIKGFLTSFFSFAWFKNIWSLPLILPDIASAMISEISVFDSYFTNTFSFLESGLRSSALGLAAQPDLALANPTAGTSNILFNGFGKFMIGFFNSFFLFLPTSTAHLITLRRFVMQGLEAGYIAGLGTIAGNFLWLASIILGLRFIVIPWLSLDIFRYVLGFVLLVKYLWDSSKELNKVNQSTFLEDNTKKNIFLLNFLLALTEQTSIYPFISNISFGAQGSILEGFSGAVSSAVQGAGSGALDNSLWSTPQFFYIHGFYLLGILLGSFSLLQFSVWFWENPAFSIYTWVISSYRVTTSSYYKILNFVFLYLTMLCAISSIPYFGLDYTVTNPLGLIPQDRLIDQKTSTVNGPGDPLLPETSFLATKPTDKNSRIRDGVHARRERWKERLIKYQAFDASLYDQGAYDILTIEDLNYGFDRFWLRRKLRNHQIRFRLFPGPWMRSLKKQLNKPGFTGPRVEFFRILFEQYYHPSFHATTSKKNINLTKPFAPVLGAQLSQFSYSSPVPIGIPSVRRKATVGRYREVKGRERVSLRSKETLAPTSLFIAKKAFLENNNNNFKTQKGLINQYSALRKFSRNFSNRINSSSINNANALSLWESETPVDGVLPKTVVTLPGGQGKGKEALIYSKSLKSLFNQINKEYPKEKLNIFRNISKQYLTKKEFAPSLKKTNIRKKLSKKEKLLLSHKAYLYSTNNSDWFLPKGKNGAAPLSAFTQTDNLKPLDFYLQKDEAFKRKLKYYSTTVTRKLSVGNNAPFFKTMLKKAFYYHKPSLRWRRTMFTAAMRRGFRKKATKPKKLVYTVGSFLPSGSGGPSLTSGERLGFLIPPTGDTTEENQPMGIPSVVRKAPLGSANIMDNVQVGKPTTSYSVLGKRASRYRYQIYKDVLQHWYYTPFNRLLLKFDIDSFINRQPKAHFLTKKEERLLHLRRVLLSEHYNTLRWYTYMQHYRTMKSRIGGTKSFANTVYNQQFQGTFKKIRHLFSITPSQGEMTVLKFDQVLYNPTNQNSSFPGQKENLGTLSKPLPYFHEGLSASGLSRKALPGISTPPQDLMDQSLNVAGQYLKNEKQEYFLKIKEYIKQQNYSGLTSLLANKDLLGQTKPSQLGNNITSREEIMLFYKLLKECKRRLNDPTFLKNYISHRLDKRGFAAAKEIATTSLPSNGRNQRAREQQENFNTNLESFKTWLSPIVKEVRSDSSSAPNSKVNPLAASTTSTETLNTFKEGKVHTTGLRKALYSGIATASKGSKVAKTEIPVLHQAALQEQIKQTLKTMQSLTNSLNSNKTGNNSKFKQNLYTTYKQTVNQILKPLLFLSKTQYRLLTKRTEKNLEWWRQKQRTITKRKSSRKKARFKGIQDVQKLKNQQNNINSSTALGTLLAAPYGTAIPMGTQREQPAQTFGGQPLAENYAFVETTLPTKAAGSLRFQQRNLRKKVDSSAGALDASAGTLNSPAGARDSLKGEKGKHQYLQNLFVKKFRKKRSSKDRHYRNLIVNRGFGYIRKPKNAILNQNNTSVLVPAKEGALAISLPNLRAFLSEGKPPVDSAKLMDYVQVGKESREETTNSSKIKNLLKQGYIKKSPAKKRSKRTWKRRKRAKFTKNHYKYRKRDVYSYGKLRTLTKKLKRIESIQEFQNWWWNNYLPNYFSLARERENNLQKQTFGASTKPLATTKALEIRQTLTQNSSLINLSASRAVSLGEERERGVTEVSAPRSNQLNAGFSFDKKTLLDKIYENLFTNSYGNSNPPYRFDLSEGENSPVGKPEADQVMPGSLSSENGSLPTSVTTNIPFYAGWDESLRKFVVTNRLLSRREAGSMVDPVYQEVREKATNPKISFTKAPIKGLNEGTFLYLQTQAPLAFNAYTIDQFVPNNQSFYAPLGWKRFEFRHSILKNWLKNKAFTASTQGVGSSLVSNQNKVFLFTRKTNFKYFKDSAASAPLGQQNRQQTKKTKALQNRRIKKRYKMLKQTPIQLMYLPTGTLLTEILPSHYISVFDKQYRFPRNRYLKRNLPKATTTNFVSPKELTILETSNFVKNYTYGAYSLLRKEREGSENGLSTRESVSPSLGEQTYQLDFTLRKRIKPRRKYHKKRFTKKEGLIFPRRRKFGTWELSGRSPDIPEGEAGTLFRLRPSIKTKQAAQTKAKNQKRAGAMASSPKANPVRQRQLRRREFQQVFKPLQRYQPRYGGFVWPGDYLRLEIVPMPHLYEYSRVPTSEAPEGALKAAQLNKKVKSKINRKINVQPVGLLPRKYLIQKHNLKVLKKKMALSQLTQ